MSRIWWVVALRWSADWQQRLQLDGMRSSHLYGRFAVRLAWIMGGRSTNLLRWLRLIGFSKNFGSHISTIIYTSNDLNLQSWTKERPWPSQIASWILQRHLHDLKDMTNPSQLERYAKNGYMSVIVQGRAEKPFGTGPTKYLEALDWKGPTKPLRSKISSMFINHEVFHIHSVGKV